MSLAVDVTEKTITSMMADYLAFKASFENYAMEVCWDGCRLQPSMVDRRLRDAYSFWIDDIKRVGEIEPNLEEGLDHFKLCGHLAYWLRRTSPVVEFTDYSSPCEDDEGKLTPDQEDFKDLLYEYGSEYLAFDLAFNLCMFHEQARADKTERSETLKLSRDYIRMVCHFMKCKHVSPHALTLLFKSLFQ